MNTDKIYAEQLANKYAPKDTTKVVALRKLDTKAKLPATVFTYTFGIVTADESVMGDGKIDMSKVNAIAFDPYTHGYYKVTERVGEAFRDGLKLKK